MIIGKPGEVGQSLPAQRTGGAAAARPGIAAPVASDQERVDGSAAATQVSLSDASRSMITADSRSDEVRAARVAELKLAIDEGRYRIDAGRIADRLIADNVGLLAKAGGRGR